MTQKNRKKLQITVKIKLEPAKEQAERLKTTSAAYVCLVNQIVVNYVEADMNLKYTSKDVIANLPSAVKNQAIQDAKSVFAKYKKAVRTNGKLKPEDQKQIKVPVIGNGRQNKFVKRQHRSIRRKLGKLKKLKAMQKRHDKEQRWMKDQDHKISRQIINFAKENSVSTIRLEALSGIRQTARTSRKNEKNLHTWSFYRLAQYIEYKAYLQGIKVLYVDPKHTSQKCPKCGERNLAKDRKYKCGCGYKAHRDRVGAMNIMSATVVDGVA